MSAFENEEEFCPQCERRFDVKHEMEQPDFDFGIGSTDPMERVCFYDVVGDNVWVYIHLAKESKSIEETFELPEDTDGDLRGFVQALEDR